jgi:hypothetical protein
MEPLKERQSVIDLSSFTDVPDAISADVDSKQVTVQRRKPGGDSETVVVFYPAGIKVVTRR